MADQDVTPEVEALQAVVDRVVSWQDGATEGTVRDELRTGTQEAGLQVDDGLLDELAERIQAGPDRAEVERLVASRPEQVRRA